VSKNKVKTAWFCKSCGNEFPKWLGKCTACGEWNTIVEEVIENNTQPFSYSLEKKSTKQASKPTLISEINYTQEERYLFVDQEFNRVLGGGLVPGSLILFGGDPGIGKSTLMLQLALHAKGIKTLYVSGEESEFQIKMRAERIKERNNNFYILCETSTQQIFKQIESFQPDLLIIDSIQTLHSQLLDSSPGSISQIKECAGELMKFAKETNIPVFIIGHITKDGTIAGPKLLEHMVDTVLQFEGDANYVYRLLRTLKNRFGSTNELGIYEMTSGGLREVSNPSEILITHRDEPTSGVAIAATIEGMRPLMIEIQALVSTAVYGTPQRATTGFDIRRLNMLLAVLEKRCGFRLAGKDVFLNIAGGLKIEDPAIDLAVVMAILSSNEDVALPFHACFAAEVGLSGEIRPVNRIEQRISEAEKLGFTQIFISKYNTKGLRLDQFKIKIIPIAKIEELGKKIL
jgi:DNA repair protein RadA/Sms